MDNNFLSKQTNRKETKRVLDRTSRETHSTKDRKLEKVSRELEGLEEKNTPSTLHNEATVNNMKGKSSGSWLGPLIGLAAILAVAALVYFNWPQHSSQELAALNWDKNDIQISMMQNASLPSENSKKLEKAYDYYQRADYRQAMNALSKVTATEEVILMKGACLYKLGNSKGAVQQFDQIIRNPKVKDKDEAHWYAALSYLDMGQKEKARHALKQVKNWPKDSANSLLDNI